MNRAASGTYRITATAGEQMRAFVPLPLPPAESLEITGAQQLLLERATLAVGRLDSISTLLPEPQLFLYSYVRREAVLSSQIEGTQSSLSDLLLFEMEEAPGTPLDDVVEVSNCIASLEHGTVRLRDGFPLSNRLLREMHAALKAKGRGSDKQPGEFRRSQNWIGGTRPGNEHFVPPPPEEVESCMGALERFLHSETNGLPALLRAALAHVQFETIHPFLDGNGRIGRLLIALLLHHGGLLAEPLLYLSLFSKKTAQPTMTCWTGCGTLGTGRRGWISFSKASSKPPGARCRQPAGWSVFSKPTPVAFSKLAGLEPMPCVCSPPCVNAPHSRSSTCVTCTA